MGFRIGSLNSMPSRSIFNDLRSLNETSCPMMQLTVNAVWKLDRCRLKSPTKTWLGVGNRSIDPQSKTALQRFPLANQWFQPASGS
ncbi:MAG: hypothetical protein CMJ78_02520 [Planctomycetaceae bacterium]|nr:hypothetical protein [Planctomycetaceae bacterium]